MFVRKIDLHNVDGGEKHGQEDWQQLESGDMTA